MKYAAATRRRSSSGKKQRGEKSEGVAAPAAGGGGAVRTKATRFWAADRAALMTPRAAADGSEPRPAFHGSKQREYRTAAAQQRSQLPRTASHRSPAPAARAAHPPRSAQVGFGVARQPAAMTTPVALPKLKQARAARNFAFAASQPSSAAAACLSPTPRAPPLTRLPPPIPRRAGGLR
jgi:hypothetical protein